VERVGVRIGVDLGGTKIEAMALDGVGNVLGRIRVPTPPGYSLAVDAMVQVVQALEAQVGEIGTVGVGMPGSLDGGLVKNANRAWLNGKPLERDLGQALGREVRCTNDANCFAVSEATDGAGVGHDLVFAAILGTGCGAGIAWRRQPLPGRAGLAGEWGHNGLPWPRDDEFPGPPCYCGKRGCLEMWISGPGMALDYLSMGGQELGAPAIAAAAGAGEPLALQVLERYVDRLARGIATVVNLLDPDVIVLGGGLSNIESLGHRLTARVPCYVFGGECTTPILPARHGDSSGVRGAAWLWPSASSELG
jgi:fructokinase